MRGSVCLYQGEELGLTEAYVPFEELQDPYGKRFWPKFRGRDGCRTPMPWLSDNLYAGFSETKPWLPVAMEHLRMSVSAQDGDPESMLAFYRRMLAWRKTRPALGKGSFALQETSDSLISYVRALGEEAIFCAFNLGPDPLAAALPEGEWRVVEGTGFAGAIVGRQVELPPYQALFAERAGAIRVKWRENRVLALRASA